MKIRVGLVLAAVAGVVWLSGCQSSAGKTEEPTAAAAKWVEKPAAAETADAEKPKTRTVRMRDPKTGEIITKEVPIASGTASRVSSTTSSDDKPKTRAVRTRDAATGRIVTKEVPVTTTPPDDKPKTRTVRTRNPKTGEIVSKEVPVPTSEPTKPASEPFEITWSEKCSVEQAFNATNQLLYETLGLQKVGKGGGYYYEPVSDYISATMKARSTIDVTFDVYIVLDSDESVMITIKQTGGKHPTEIIQKHIMFVKQKISEAIIKEPEAADVEPAPFPKTIVLNSSVDQIYTDINNWVKEAGLQNPSPPGGDRYYRWINCRSASGIEFSFRIRMIDVDKTKLTINIEKYEGKDELNVILKSLEAALVELDKPAEAVDEAAADTQTRRVRRKQQEWSQLSREDQMASLEGNIAAIEKLTKDPDRKEEREAWKKLLEQLRAEQKKLEAEKQPADVVEDAAN